MRSTDVAWCALALALGGGCAPEPRTVDVALLAPEALGCRPTEVSELRVTPLGDFPSELRPSVHLDPAGGPQAVPRFPAETELVAVAASGVVRLAGGGTTPWEGGGLVRLDGGDTLVVPLLRFGRACALSDPSARVLPGAVAFPLDDGRVLTAGGRDSGAVLASIVTVRPGERLAQRAELRLFTPRTGASGLVLPGDRVLVVGGAAADPGPVLDSIELLRVEEGAEARLADGFLARARRDHAAARIGDDVLIVGGRDEAGAIADAEALAIGDSVTSRPAGPAVARWGAAALALDDGGLLVVGGEDAAGPSAAIERWEGGLVPLAELRPPRADAAWVALPGARVARVGGQRDGAWSRRVELLLERGDVRVDLGEVLAPVEAPVASALIDGRILVVGRDPVSGRASAQVIDPGGTRPRVSVEPSRVATHLLRLLDGTLVEADAAGMSLLRLDLASELDDPQATLFPGQPEQREELSLDAAPRWRVEGDRLVASADGARLDLPSGRFRDVRVELEVSGVGAVLFDVDGAAPHVLELDEAELRFGSCAAPRAGSIRLERVGAALRFGGVECAFDERARVGIGLRLREGAGVRRLSVTRLAPR